MDGRTSRHVMGGVRLLCCHPSITRKPSRRMTQGQLDTHPSSLPHLLISSPSFWPDGGFFLQCPRETAYTAPTPAPVFSPLLISDQAAGVKHKALLMSWLLERGTGIGRGGGNKWCFYWDPFPAWQSDRGQVHPAFTAIQEASAC